GSSAPVFAGDGGPIGCLSFSFSMCVLPFGLVFGITTTFFGVLRKCPRLFDPGIGDSLRRVRVQVLQRPRRLVFLQHPRLVGDRLARCAPAAWCRCPLPPPPARAWRACRPLRPAWRGFLSCGRVGACSFLRRGAFGFFFLMCPPPRAPGGGKIICPPPPPSPGTHG